MAKEKPQYEVVEEFVIKASKIVEKYPTIFYGANVDGIRCVKITNKDRPEKKQKKWDLQAVKMPVLMDAPYSYYVTVYASDWDSMGETQKLLLVAEVMNAIPKDLESEGQIIAPDTKGYSTMYRTFGGIDYLDNPDSPNILNKDINWIQTNF